jgi:hypothetical protein
VLDSPGAKLLSQQQLFFSLVIQRQVEKEEQERNIDKQNWKACILIDLFGAQNTDIISCEANIL